MHNTRFSLPGTARTVAQCEKAPGHVKWSELQPHWNIEATLQYVFSVPPASCWRGGAAAEIGEPGWIEDRQHPVLPRPSQRDAGSTLNRYTLPSRGHRRVLDLAALSLGLRNTSSAHARNALTRIETGRKIFQSF